jgi:2-succinyl-6-hydroxy-2,4-cyclohexadiene-1-carboxylate synthase
VVKRVKVIMFIKSFDGTKIYYRLNKKKSPVLVFVHGWVNNWTAWKKEIDYFQKKGYSTLALDLRGHGQSDKPEKRQKYKIEMFAKDLNEIIKKEKIKNFVLIGHSMGGMIALTYYKLFKQKPKALVLCDTTAESVAAHKKLKSLVPILKIFFEFIMPKHVSKKYVEGFKDIDFSKCKGKELKLHYEGWKNISLAVAFNCVEAMVDFDAKDVLRKIKVPTLIMEGEHDTVLPKEYTKELYKEIKKAEFDIIPNTNHYINIEKPKLISNIINKFLEKNKLKPKYL